MTETSIIKILMAWMDRQKFPFQMCNAFIWSWECDYFTMTQDGVTREFEIKISRADFLNDAKKPKHQSIGANYFYYVCPDGLIKIEEIDKRYGLIYIKNESYVEVVKKPRSLNNAIFKDWKMLANKMNFRYQALWRELWIKQTNDNKMTRDEFIAGFNIDLECTVPMEDQIPAL